MGKEVEKIENKAAMVIYIAVTILFGGLFGCWLRIFDVMAGRTLFTLAMYAGVAVAGVLVGAAVSFLRGNTKKNALVFCLIMLAAAGYHIFLMNAVNGMAASWQNILLDTARDFNLYLKIAFKSSAIFILFFGLLAGVAGMQAFRSNNIVFSFSWSIPGVVGFLVGCWFFSSFFVSLFGMGWTLRILPGLLGGVAAAALIVGGERKILSVAVLSVTAGAYFHIMPLSVDALPSKGTFGRLVYRDSGFAFGDPVEELNTLRHTISIYEDRDYQFVFEMDNRPVMFGSRYHTARTLNAYIPILIKPASETVLLVGDEAGLFAPFFLRAGVDELKYCQTERAIVKEAFEQSTRVQVNEKKAIDCLKSGDFSEKYDLIVFTPEPAYLRGSARFFSGSLLRKAAKSLNENGAVALHLDARALTCEAFATILAGMREVFPHIQVWSTGVHEWMIVGSNDPLRVKADKVLGIVNQNSVIKDFARAGKLSVADVAACMVCDEIGVDRWLDKHEKRVPLCKISWEAPRRVFSGVNALMSPVLFEKVRQLSVSGWLQQGDLDEGVYQALIDKVEKNIAARLSAVMAVATMAGDKPAEGLRCAREAADVNPHDALLVQFSDTLELEGRRRISIGDYKGAVRCYENILSFNKDSPQAHYGMGYCLRANGDTQNAYIHFARAVFGAPEQVNYRLEFAEVALSAGQFETADKQYKKVLELNPDDAQTMLLYAKALVYKGREDRQPEQAIDLAKKACNVTKWQVPEAVIGLADMYIEAGRVMEGMGLKRSLKEGGMARIKREFGVKK